METVVGCKQVKEWMAKDGKKVPIYAVELSDGQGGESFGKEIPVGTPLSELVLESGQYGLKIKWNKPGASGGFSGGGKSRSGNESFAMSYAKDIVVGGKTDLKNLLPLADKIYAWLEAKKAVTPPVFLASQLPNPPKVNSNNPADQDDLPF